MIGTIVHHYEILEQLGGGGMGIVYKARDTKLQRFVALKFLPPELSRDPKANERFVQEARAASALDHPNICTIYDVGETEDGKLFIVMAFYHGQTLKYRLEDGAIDHDEAVHIASQIAEGLAAAHRQGIIHRDIKPANIMVTDDGTVKILDFGLAKLTGGLDLTSTGSTVGTAYYMSPEQLRGEEVDHRTDLWSLGVVLYQMLKGARPFEGDYQQAVAYAIVHTPPEKIDDVREALWSVLERLLAKDPDDRFADVNGLIDALGQMWGKRTSSRFRLRPAAARAVLVFVAVSAGALGYYSLTRSDVDGGEVATDPNRIAVFPFTVRGDSELEYLSEGFVDLFSLSLGGAGAIETVDPNVLLGRLRKEQIVEFDPIGALRVARTFRAGHVLIGTINRVGEQIQINAALYRDAEEAVVRLASSAADEGSIPSSIDQISRDLVRVLLTDYDESLASIAELTTPSYGALREYLSGSHAVRRGQWDEAAAHFRSAIDADSNFALPWSALAYLGSWGVDVDIVSTAKKAYDLRSALPRRHRLVIEAIYANTVEGRRDQAELLYRQVLADYPDDLDALVGLGELFHHFNSLEGRLASESIPYFERVLAAVPGHIAALFHLYDAFLKEGDYANADSLLEIMLSGPVPGFYGGDQAPLLFRELTKVRDLQPGDTTWTYEALDSLTFDATRFLLTAITYALEDPKSASKIIDDILRSGQFVGRDADILLRQAANAAAMGQLRKHDNLLRQAGTSAAGRLVRRVWIRSMIEYPGVEAVLDTLRQEIVQWDTVGTRFPSFFDGRDRYGGEYGLIKLYLRGLVALAAGEGAEIAAIKDSFRSRANPGHRALLKELEAIEHLRSGEYRESLEALGRLRQIQLDSLARGPFARRITPAARWVRAEALTGIGELTLSLNAYKALREINGGIAFMFGPSYIRQAEIYEQMGNTEKAIEYYARLVRLWENCDPELIPMREAARAQLDRLLAESVREPAG